MIASPIDPRDQAIEVDAPSYRVYFWSGPGACDEWELKEADLDDVLDWVRVNSNGRTHNLWAVARSGDEVELIRLRGIDPTTDSSVYPAWAEEAKA